MPNKQIFYPIDTPIRGKIKVPGDKSISQRSIFLACMAQGESHIYDVAYSSDVMSAIEIMRKLGATIDITRSKYSNARNMDLKIDGWGSIGPKDPTSTLYCGNSATSVRVTMGVLAGYDVEATFDGDESLHRRPLMRVIDPLLQMGASFKVLAPKDGRPQRSTLPCIMKGSAYTNPIFYDMPVASSQVKASILFAALNTSGTTTLTEPYLSRTHTELLLEYLGAPIKYDSDLHEISITGPYNINNFNLHVPGDVSSASYFLTAACLIPGSKIEIENVCLNESRLGFIKVLSKMGARISYEVKKYKDNVNYGLEPVGSISAQYGGRLKGVEVSCDEIPQLVDEVPILSLAAACSEGKMVFYGVKELKLKECNRINAISQTLNSLGADAYNKGDNLYITGGIDIEGKKTLKPIKSDVINLNHYGDHRLAIVCALAGICGFVPTSLDDLDVMKISYPDFMDDFSKVIS